MKVRDSKTCWRAVLAAALVVGFGCAEPEVEPGGEVPVDASLPPVHFSKETGYEVAWGTPDAGVVLALRDVNDSAVGKLDLLEKGKESKAISGGTDANVKVSLTQPASALFLESVGGSQGVLAYASLADAKKISVPEGTATLIDKFWFGPESNTVLFLADAAGAPVRAKMYFWDGEASTELATGVAPESVLFSKDRKFAVVGTDVNGQGVGDVKRVELSTGDIEEVARGVTVLSGAASAISLDDAGAAVAFVTTSGDVTLWTNGDAKTLGKNGVLPGVSSDGKAVAWLSDGRLVISKDGGVPVTVSMADGGEGDVRVARTPRFDPLNEYVAWFDKVVTTGGPVSDVFVASTKQDGVAVKLADAVSLATFRFSEKSSRVSAVMGLKNAGGSLDGKAVGKLGLGAPGEPLSLVSEKVFAAGVSSLLASDRVAFIANVKAGSGADGGRGELYVTPENLDGEPLLIAQRVAPGSVRTPTSEFDRILYLTLEDSDRYTAKGDLKGALWATKVGSAPKRLESNVIFWSISPKGRAVAVVAEGPNAGVWTFPLAL